ncbi:MAG: 4-alpha-glucanotransferase [Vulcanimicrobiaceae bacterium]
MTPQRAYIPPFVAAGRAWGFAINLYALRSQRNWGIGDFTDLRDIVRFAASSGADLVGVNPLHALHYVEPEAASPYSPTSRYFCNPLYLDIEAIPEFACDHERAARLRARVRSADFSEMLAGLRAAPHVAYTRVARAKYSALDECYAIFREAGGVRTSAFRAYVDQGGARLESFALYEALTERFVRSDGTERGWLFWPAEFRDPAGEAVRVFALEARGRIDYFKYVQWLTDEQLAAAAGEARALAVGLYLDVAVGVDRNSADVWFDTGAYALDETVGAPPDPLGPHGQNWGLAPLDPAGMLRDGGAAFAELLETNMRHAGALRLDHVMALLRVFRIPFGQTAAHGRYVAYPFDELLAIARAASEAAGCLIVGEDLGSVPPGFRERMEREGIFSYRVLLFEREHDGTFRPPERYPEFALATATTHDVPTLVGWAVGRDIDTHANIGLTSSEHTELAHNARRVEVSLLLDALRGAGELDTDTFERLHHRVDRRRTDPGDFDDLVRAAYRFLARSPARLVLVQLDDALGELEQVNLPGTDTEYPNWRRKSAVEIHRLASDPHLQTLVADVRRLVTERTFR